MGSLLTSTSMSPHKCTRDIPCCRPGCNPGSRPCSLGTAAPDNLSLCPLCASLCPKYPPPARLPRLAPASRFVPASGLVMSGAVFQCPFVPLPGSFFSRPVRHTPHDALQGARKYTAPPVQYGGVHRFVLPKLANGRPGNPVSCDQRICNFLRLLQLLPEWFVIVPFRAYIPSSAFLRVCGINFSQRFALLAHKANLFFMKFLKASCLQVKALPLP